MTFPTYPKYQDTDVDWLGGIPGHWQTKPLWALFRRTKRTGYSDERLLSVYRDYGVVPKDSRDDNNNKPSEDLSPYQLVQPGDLVINKMKAWQGSVAVSLHRGIVSPAYFVFEALHNENSRYLHYLLRSVRYITGYMTVSKGIRVNQWDLDPQYHATMPVLIPPIDEQTGIASFLDRETTKIDDLVAEQERLIALLKEKRQAVISHAVTKGLNPDVPMKDSGVEWLGVVPLDWQVKKLSKLTSAIGDGLHGTPQYAEDTSYFFVNGNNLSDGKVLLGGSARCINREVYDKHQSPLNENTILISINGTIGNLAKYRGELISLGKSVAYLNFSQEIVRDYQFYFMQSTEAQRYFCTVLTGTTINNLSLNSLRQMYVCVPAKNEQTSIAQYLDSEVGRIDQLLLEANRAVMLIKERRSALISAAVTGKIDVRGLVDAEEAA